MDDKMSGSKKHSLKVNVAVNGSAVESATSAESTTNQEPLTLIREVYKQLSEDSHLPAIVNGKEKSNSNSVEPANVDDSQPIVEEISNMVHEKNNAHDGADEEMLSLEEDKLGEKRDEVKFIKNDHQNGDAKIDIGVVNGKETDSLIFTGMSKEELMKYANDPFWVRIRWIFFIAFWAIWAGMLVGAILIIIDAPKCAAPEPLPWYKRGPLAKFDGLEVGSEDIKNAQKMHARGVIYELPPEDTYTVKEPSVEQKIKHIVEKYKQSDISIVLDITANYVNENSQLMKDALSDPSKQSAFFWVKSPNAPTNWLAIQNGSAWKEIQPGNFVLSQFGDGLYDLHMNDSIVKEHLSESLRHLLELGVNGFRLRNSKFFILSKKLKDELVSKTVNFTLTDYLFWTHSKTTLQEGLGDALYDYLAVVKNVSSTAFLSVADDIARPEVYQSKQHANSLGIELPVYGHFAKSLGSETSSARLSKELNDTIQAVGDLSWVQWNFGDITVNSTVPADAYALFMSLVPGTAVLPVNSQLVQNISNRTFDHITKLRETPSFMHGEFEVYNLDGLLAYTRIKPGNPGYFVVFNPLNEMAKYSNETVIHHKLQVDFFSDNFNDENKLSINNKITNHEVKIPPRSTVVYTYVPTKAE